jgi:site-specific recombinase XerD
VRAIPGGIPELFTSGDVALFRAEDRLFEAMVDGWRAQLLARGLASDTIKQRTTTIERFQRFTNDYPWSWGAQDVDEYFASLRSRERPLALTTLRSYSAAVRSFCGFVCDDRYGWAALSERLFGALPSQIVFEWNSPRHTTDDAVTPGRRAFTREELQRFFDCADDFVDTEYSARSKRWLPALRDSVAFKVAYAFGLRRRELAMLETIDFGPNPRVERFGMFGTVQVRWAKGTAGSGPRRRTVLTVPEFDWVVPLLESWCSPAGRGMFTTADRSNSLWPTERDASTGLRSFDRTFQRVRTDAGLPREPTLHALRHSYVTHLIEAGYDPLFVQQQVGHQYSSTTALYTSVSSDFKQKAVQEMIARRLRLGGTDDE